MKFKEGKIGGVVVKPLYTNNDERGRFMEVWRSDWCAECGSDKIEKNGSTWVGGRCKDCGAIWSRVHSKNPAMLYLFNTNKYVIRGPHEHVEQTDMFCFMNKFVVRLWDNRKDSKNNGNRMTLIVRAPIMVVVPPGVVHAYMSLEDNGLVLNLPDRLYAGMGKSEKVDEIRHENKKNSPYNMDDWNNPLRVSGRLVPMPTKIIMASQNKIKKHQENINKLLKLLGHPEALVTDESTLADFSIFGKTAFGALTKLQRKLGFVIHLKDKLVDVASRMR